MAAKWSPVGWFPDCECIALANRASLSCFPQKWAEWGVWAEVWVGVWNLIKPHLLVPPEIHWLKGKLLGHWPSDVVDPQQLLYPEGSGWPRHFRPGETDERNTILEPVAFCKKTILCFFQVCMIFPWSFVYIKIILIYHDFSWLFKPFLYISDMFNYSHKSLAGPCTWFAEGRPTWLHRGWIHRPSK